MRIRYMLAATLCILVNGCVTLGQATPEDLRRTSLQSVQAQLTQKRYDDAYKSALPHLDAPGEVAEQIRSLVRSTPQLRQIAFEDLKRSTEINAPIYVDSFLEKLKVFQQGKLIDESAIKEVVDWFDKMMREGNESGALPFTVLNNLDFTPSLRTDKARRIVFLRSLELVERGEKGRLSEAVFAWAERAGPVSDDFQALKVKLPHLKFSHSDLSTYVSRVFPEFAAKAIEEQSIRIHLTIEPQDRLLYEDVKKQLISNPVVSVVTGPSAATNMFTVTIKKHQLEFHQEPERTQQVSFPQHEVDTVSAVLLMPRNSSYLYDVTSGSAEVEYAMEVIVSSNGKESMNELLRDKIVRPYSFCANQRVQNVFGGSERANWIANDRMRSQCGNSIAPVRASSLRDDVISLLAKKVLSVPAISSKLLN